MNALFHSLGFLLLYLLFNLVTRSAAQQQDAGGYGGGTIVISSVSRAHTDFGLYSLPVSPALLSANETPNPDNSGIESWLTNDNGTMRYNGHVVRDSEKRKLLEALGRAEDPCNDDGRCRVLAYVSEEEGTLQVHFGAVTHSLCTRENIGSQRSLTGCNDGWTDFRKLGRLHDLILPATEGRVPFYDRASVAGGRVIYVGMREPKRLRQSWAAVFSKDLGSGEERCLTVPENAADFSPAVSPSGEWIIVASDQCHGFNGEMCSVNSDLHIFSVEDGSKRRLLVKDGGWPCWAHDGSRFFFHRRSHDGWWSVFEARIPPSANDPVLEVQRLTDPGFHAFTPAASPSGPAPGALEWIAVATRRHGAQYRQIEILILETRQLIPLTHSHFNHYNPFIFPDGSSVGYHRCNNFPHRTRNLEYIASPLTNTSLLRIDGDFPSFSRDGSFVAFTPGANIKDAGVDVMRVDGLRRKTIFPWKISSKVFGTAWHEGEQGRAVVYTSMGQDIFMAEDASTYIVAISFNASKLLLPEEEHDEHEHGVLPSEIKVLTTPKDKNNAFPSPSPDGKRLVVSSSRSGHHNLYIIDAENGAVLERLTEGEWTDIMCSWSPVNEWIVFTSNRESRQKDTGGEAGHGYGVFVVHPDNKSNVVQVTKPGLGIAGHPQFSPDGESLLLTTDYAGLSAEPIAGPNQFQPYGEVYLCSLDWSRIEDGCVQLRRLTFSPYETALAAWGRTEVAFPTVRDEGRGPPCMFQDLYWLHNASQELRLCRPSYSLGRHPPEDYHADLSLYEKLKNISLHRPPSPERLFAYKDEL